MGEDLAVRYLEDHGWQVLERNWRPRRPRRGELDIIALQPVERACGPDDGRGQAAREGRCVLVAVEVKTRTSTAAGPPAQAVTADKLARLGALAVHWAASHDVPHAGLRVDVISVLLRPGRTSQIRHHRVVQDGAAR